MIHDSRVDEHDRRSLAASLVVGLDIVGLNGRHTTGTAPIEMALS